MTLEIQNVSFYPDQFDKASDITLDKAIYVFQNLHWEEQLKEFERRESTSIFPLYSLRDGKRNFTVTKESEKGFSCFYTNGRQYSEFFISELFDPESEPNSVEIFIGKFFHGTIEEELNLSPIDESEHLEEIPQQEKKVYRFNAWKKTWLLLPSLLFLIFVFLLIYIANGSIVGMGWFLYILTGIVCLAGVVPHISYWVNDAGAILEIDPANHRLIYRKGNSEIEVNREDIEWCRVNYSESSIGASYSFLRLQLKNRSHLIITNFVTEPMNIVTDMKLHYERSKLFFPLLPIL